jgi:hypothetical protein
LSFRRSVSSGCRDETILLIDETIFGFDAELRKRRMVTNFAKRNGEQRRQKTGDSQMRTLSFLLAFAFVLAGPTLAGSPDGNLPGFGAFAYSGSALVTAAPAIVVAAR